MAFIIWPLRSNSKRVQTTLSGSEFDFVKMRAKWLETRDVTTLRQVPQMDMKQKLQQDQHTEKKTYTPPRLVNFGDVRHLTQSGSSNGNEVVGTGGDGLKTPKP
jgi:hypothetical protein